MKPEPSRVSFTVLATFLSLIAAMIAFDPTASQPSISTAARKAPDPDRLALAEWATGRPGGNLSAMRPGDLQAALEPKAHGFELFRQPADQPPALLEERRFLAKLPYGRAMWRAAVRHRMDGLLLAAVVQTESSFSPTAVSPDGAIGLMQVIPETGELYGKAADLFDPDVNLNVGCQYLAGLIDRFHGDLTLAVAAYNAGPAAVARYRGVPPFPETRGYVKSVLSLYVDHRQSVWKAEAGRGSHESLTTRETATATAHGLFSLPAQAGIASSSAR